MSRPGELRKAERIPRNQSTPLVSLTLLSGFLLCIGPFDDANAQSVDSPADATGVRHAISVSVELDRGTFASKENVAELAASIRIAVRVLDYAADSRFYGVVNGDFSDFDPSKGAVTQEIWADRKCHQNRGLPKIWVLAINGRIAQGARISDVSALPRHIGQLIPDDEIVVQKDRRLNAEDPTQTLAIQVKTKKSRVSVTLMVKTARCHL